MKRSDVVISLKRPVTLEKPDLRGRGLVTAIAVSACLLAPLGLRGYWRACRLLGRYSGDRDTCGIRLTDDTIYRIKLSDPYWARLIGRFYTYEPELEALFRRLKGVGYTFIDGGANFGYWSVLLTSAEFGKKSVVAIEPSEKTFEILSENNLLNGNRFTLVQRAISDTTDERVLFRNFGDHAGARLAGAAAPEDPPPVFEEMVRTITVDDIFAQYVPDKDKPVVLKLDVEGAEIPALKGARRVLSRDPLVIYEDHGKDMECAVSRFVLENLNMEIFHVSDAGNISAMNTIEEIRSIKVRKGTGYNFLALNRNSIFREIIIQPGNSS